MKLYEHMARTAVAWRNCVKSNNEEWRRKHSEHFVALLDELPHGSGIDGSWNIELEKCGDGRLVLFSSFHHMDEHGGYNGWTDFTVTVRPSLMHGCRVEVTGKFPRKYEDTRDYLHEIIEYALTRELEEVKR